MPFIDVHHHILPRPYVAAVGAHAVGSQGSSGRVPSWSVDEAVSGMDRAGIQASVVSVSSPGLRGLGSREENYWARWCNDFSAQMATDHPARFGFFATLPMLAERAMLEECAYSFDSLNAEGVCLLSNHGGDYLGTPRFEALYQELDRRAAVVFVHPTAPRHEVLVGGMSSSMLEFPFDTTRAIASLLFQGVFRRYPRIQWIFAHAGGAMPYLAGRLQTLCENNAVLAEMIPDGISAELRRLYFDCALSFNATTLQALVSEVTPARCLFGSDYPFGPPHQMSRSTHDIARFGLAEEDLRRIAVDNACALFPRMARRLAAGHERTA